MDDLKEGLSRATPCPFTYLSDKEVIEYVNSNQILLTFNN